MNQKSKNRIHFISLMLRWCKRNYYLEILTFYSARSIFYETDRIRLFTFDVNIISDYYASQKWLIQLSLHLTSNNKNNVKFLDDRLYLFASRFETKVFTDVWQYQSLFQTCLLGFSYCKLNCTLTCISEQLSTDFTNKTYILQLCNC